MQIKYFATLKKHLYCFSVEIYNTELYVFHERVTLNYGIKVLFSLEK